MRSENWKIEKKKRYSMVLTRSQRRKAETGSECRHTKKKHTHKKKRQQGQFDVDAVSKPSLAVGLAVSAAIVAAISKVRSAYPKPLSTRVRVFPHVSFSHPFRTGRRGR